MAQHTSTPARPSTQLAAPFFLLSGAFMTTGGVARRLIDFANACVGHIRGGLAIAAVLACMLFAGVPSSSLLSFTIFS
ncbi:TRAP transporter large permease subunit, partial [Klebsiella pneumoniae]|uniref:TRAP transporter large permease subunit n=1 Tax=Klebsiella pneumoniae TaxID=573 RepID=UPI00396A3FF4